MEDLNEPKWAKAFNDRSIEIDDEIFNENQPREGYGAYITHDILNHDQLNDRQKILYARIHNLTNKKGYCFASNEWFSNQMKTSIPTIKRDLKSLRDISLIHQVMRKTKTGSIRLIYLGGCRVIDKQPSITELGGGQLTSDTRGQLTSDPHNIIEIKNSKPGEKKSPGNLPIDEMIVANEKRLRHLPKTVSKKKVTLSEANWVLVSMKMFNDVRAFRLGKLNDPSYRWLTPDLKACRQLVELFRDDPNVKDSWYATIENMFNAGCHKENNWQYLTPEFVSRKTKYDIYYKK